MTTWILIIAFYNAGVTQIEYTNQERCVAAIEEVTKNTNPRHLVKVFCVRKD